MNTAAWPSPVHVVVTAETTFRAGSVPHMRFIRDAFARARPNEAYARLYAAAVARRQTAA